MTESITVSKEDYLKAILEAESEGHHVIPATLAHWLSVSAPAVTMALKRLKRDGFVEVKPDGPDRLIRLTASGKEKAYRTALRHHLIERMLSEIFGMEWYEIHAEAERLEHAVSPAFEARLIEKLGEQGTCPHGNTVLPENPTQRRKRGLIQLSEGVESTDYLVSALYERDPKLLVFLYQSGISPNVRVRLLAKNYDQTVSIQTPVGPVTLGRPAAERVWVKRVSSRESGKDSIK
ncbi:MAG TPA: metal-dependent transcriptional regulator [Acidobacteriaceae bacterium]|jgi:DtxR family Mn-dependent transcriptional regulator|nr:metal-dependent transcriptional regulator [Acidobacteriaceae bacterium]